GRPQRHDTLPIVVHGEDEVADVGRTTFEQDGPARLRAIQRRLQVSPGWHDDRRDDRIADPERSDDEQGQREHATHGLELSKVYACDTMRYGCDAKTF